MPQGDVDKLWMQARLSELGKTQRQFAEALGMHPPGLTNLLNGVRKLSAQELTLAARFLEIPLAQAVTLFGLNKVTNRYGKLPVRGYVDATTGSVILRMPVESGTLEEIESPFPGYEGLVVKIRGDSMMPRYRDGEPIGYTPDNSEISSLVNHEVVAETDDGRLLLKILHKGSGPDLYNLVSLNPADAPITDVRLRWASLIDWHIPRRT
jgi:transcriptional regulator with XRE-family HTH domain